MAASGANERVFPAAIALLTQVIATTRTLLMLLTIAFTHFLPPFLSKIYQKMYFWSMFA
jgi:hypothetical protein